MARETKVGLLAGLAFIICFAVILANRGREDSLSQRELPAARQLPIVDRTQDAVNPATRTVGGTRSVLPYPAVTNPAVPSDAKRVQPSPTTGADALGTEAPTRIASGDDAARRNMAGPGRADHPPRQEAAAPLTSNVLPPASKVQVMEQTLDDLAAKVGVKPRTTATPLQAGPRTEELIGTPAEKTPPSAVAKRRYTVSSGDTLSKIAHAQYGSKSANLVSAIFSANQSVLDNPDSLPAGVELVLPELASHAAAAPPASIKGDAKAKPTPRSADSSRDKAKEREKEPTPRQENSRWYQVRKGDRYYSIAKDVLGDGSRWREIHELNKDRFSDPGMIREGVRIRIPEASSESRGRRR